MVPSVTRRTGLPKEGDVRVKRVTITAASVRSQLDDFERRYSVESESMVEAFRDDRGELIETPDFHRWCSAYSAWELATHK